MFRLSRAKEHVGVTDETLLAWHAKQGSGIKLYRIGGVTMVETASVFDFIRRHPAPPLARKQAKAA